MDDSQLSEETSFVVDEVSNIIKEVIENAIGGSAYQHSKVNQWTSTIVENALGQLTKLGKPFKYIVTCIIMQKNGAGLHTASSCFWDSSTDGIKYTFRNMSTKFGLLLKTGSIIQDHKLFHRNNVLYN